MKAAQVNYQVGDIVRFRQVIDPGDEQVRFVVKEINGDRGLFRMIGNRTIQPVGCYPTADMEKEQTNG